MHIFESNFTNKFLEKLSREEVQILFDKVIEDIESVSKQKNNIVEYFKFKAQIEGEYKKSMLLFDQNLQDQLAKFVSIYKHRQYKAKLEGLPYREITAGLFGVLTGVLGIFLFQLQKILFLKNAELNKKVDHVVQKEETGCSNSLINQ